MDIFVKYIEFELKQQTEHNILAPRCIILIQWQL